MGKIKINSAGAAGTLPLLPAGVAETRERGGRGAEMRRRYGSNCSRNAATGNAVPTSAAVPVPW